MALFLLRFWPVLVPLIIYLVWMLVVRNKAKRAGQPLPSFRDGPWFWAVVASLVVGIVMFITFGLSHEPTPSSYEPPHMRDGKIVSGTVKP